MLKGAVMETKNENAGGIPSARKNYLEVSDSKLDSRIKSNRKDFEDRRNAVACFKNRRKCEDWQPEFTGVLVTEHLPVGAKCWVNVYSICGCLRVACSNNNCEVCEACQE